MVHSADNELDDGGDEDPMVTLPILNMALQRSDAIYHDSGSNRHVFFNQSSFSEYRPIQPLTVNGFGDNLCTAAVGRGSVNFKTRNGFQRRPPTHHLDQRPTRSSCTR
jgi:hypothetical protein